VVTVRYQSTGGFAGGVFGVATSRPVTYSTESSLTGLTVDGGVLSPAFSGSTTDYTVTVPQGATSMSFTATPNVPSGLVRVGDVLIDDTEPRQISLVPGEEKTVTIRSFAQDHETSTTYTLVIREAADLQLAVTGTATARCVAGKAVLTVSIANGDDVPVGVRLESTYGTKTVASLGAGKTSSHAFTTRAAVLPQGEAVVTATATVDGEDVTTVVNVPYAQTACGAGAL
jgi:hypothetical protein